MSLLGDVLGVGGSIMSGDPTAITQSVTKGIEDLFKGGQSQQQVNQQLSDLSQALNLASNTIQNIINSNNGNNANKASSPSDLPGNPTNDTSLPLDSPDDSALDKAIQDAQSQQPGAPAPDPMNPGA